MRARWLVCLALGATGCPQTADEYLAGLTDAGRADAGLGDDPDASADGGGRWVVEVRRLPLGDVVEPRGLAAAGGRVWTTDRLDDRLVELDAASGAKVAERPLPARGARALAWLDGALYVGYARELYRLDGSEATRVVDGLDELAGLCASEGGLVTAESRRRLYVRAGARMAPVLELALERDGGPLARHGDDFLMYDRSPRLDGATFTTRFDVVDALSPSRAAVRGALELPVDLGRVTGVAVDGDVLYLVGAGYGDDVGQLVKVTLATEGGR